MQQQWDAALVEARLADAGRTLMALQVPGCRPAGYRSNMPDFVREFEEAYGWTGVTMRPLVPSSRQIAEMDQVLAWVRLIPVEKFVLRRIVGARLLHRPHQDRPLFGWRKIALIVGASHEAVRGWHDVGISIIVGHLNRPGFCAASGGPIGGQRPNINQAVQRAASKTRHRSSTKLPELA